MLLSIEDLEKPFQITEKVESCSYKVLGEANLATGVFDYRRLEEDRGFKSLEVNKMVIYRRDTLGRIRIYGVSPVINTPK